MSAELQLSCSDPSQPPSPPFTGSPPAAARWCARQRWPVHPLSPGRKNPASNCGTCRLRPRMPNSCASLGEKRWCHSFHTAALTQDSIEDWWEKRPEFGTGSRLVVLVTQGAGFSAAFDGRLVRSGDTSQPAGCHHTKRNGRYKRPPSERVPENNTVSSRSFAADSSQA